MMTQAALEGRLAFNIQTILAIVNPTLREPRTVILP
jgi:hypothetical protein